MAVDIKLNEMVNDLDRRLRAIRIEECELSVRALSGLKHAGAVTLYDAQGLVLSGALAKQHGVGKRTVREVEEIIHNVSRMTPDEIQQRLGRRITDLQEVPSTEPDLIIAEDTPASDSADMLRWQLEQKEAQYQRLVQTNNDLQAGVSRLSGLLTQRDEQIVKLRRRLNRVLDGMTIEQLKALNVSFQIDWDEVDEGD